MKLVIYYLEIWFMTVTNEILICANKLANAGIKPTVALIKAKLKQQVPLPTIITTLKAWQHQPEFIAVINKEKEQIKRDKPTSITSELLDSLIDNDSLKKVIQQSLHQELSGMKSELSEVKLQLKALMTELHKKK